MVSWARGSLESLGDRWVEGRRHRLQALPYLLLHCEPNLFYSQHVIMGLCLRKGLWS